MKIFNVKENFKADFNTIFNNSKYKSIPNINNGYHSIEEIEEGSLLFIGSNPSMPRNRKDQSSENTGDRLNSISTEDNLLKKNINRTFIKLKQSGNVNQFYRKFEEISLNTGLMWSHLDLLVMRVTEQNSVKNLRNAENTNGQEFLSKQLVISKKILESVRPRIIVVADTLARDFLGKKNPKTNLSLDYKFKFDDKLGTDRINNTNSNLFNIPVLFTGMLSGQRALDLGSFERLIWHIKFVNSKISK